MMNKKQLQSEETKKRIADAAKVLFIKKGYKGTSIEDIVEVTGSSKGNIYYHFKSKEGLFQYLVEEWDKEWELKWVEKESKYHTTIDKLYGIAEQMVLDDLNHPLTKAADEFFNNEEKTSDVENRLAEMVERHLKLNEKLIREGMDSGEFKQGNVENLAVILEGLFYGLSQMSRKLSMKEALELYKLAVNVFLSGVAVQPN